MSETKEATYKSLLQRMVHMTEQRDFDEDLMKEVYGALLPPPAEAPSEPSVEETGWLYWDNNAPTNIAFNLGWQKQPVHSWDNVVPGIVRSKAADDELRERAEAGYGSAFSASKLATLTRERDDLSRKLAVAESERDAWRAKHGGASGHVDTLHRLRELDAARIADLERQLAEATMILLNRREPTEAEPHEAWMEEASNRYFLRADVSGLHIRRLAFIDALRTHAPAARYPEVVEFLDAVGEQRFTLEHANAGWAVSGFKSWSSGWHNTLAAACRAALDSRKERSDG